jgi:hypothetical protein
VFKANLVPVLFYIKGISKLLGGALLSLSLLGEMPMWRMLISVAILGQSINGDLNSSLVKAARAQTSQVL